MKPKGITWDEQPLGQISDTILAKRLGVDRTAVTAARNRRGIPRHDPGYIDWDAQPLGVVPDATIARDLGLSESAVNGARSRRGIAAVERECTWYERRIKGAWKWHDWTDVPLGMEPDEDIAQRMGTTRQVVSEARRKRGIAPYQRPAIQCPCGVLFRPRSEMDRYCSKACSTAVLQYRRKHRDQGDAMDAVIAAMARLRRAVAKAKEAKE